MDDDQGSPRQSCAKNRSAGGRNDGRHGRDHGRQSHSRADRLAGHRAAHEGRNGGGSDRRGAHHAPEGRARERLRDDHRRYLRHRRRQTGHVQYFHHDGFRRGGGGHCGGQTRQPGRLQRVRQRRCAGSPRRQHQRRSGNRRRVPPADRHRLPVRAETARRDEVCRRPAP